MLRRRISLYCLALITGILSGYICFERLEVLNGMLLLLVCGCFLVNVKKECLEGGNNDRKKLLTIMFFGLILFSVKYIELDNAVLPTENTIVGRVKSVQTKEDVVKIVLSEQSDNILFDRAKVMVTSCDFDNINIALGDILKCNGSFKEAARQENPHCFDYRLYLLSKGIRYCFRADSISVVGRDDSFHSRIMLYVYNKRLAFEESFDDEEIRAFIKGVIFGDKGDIDESVIDDFNSNSTGHILAVSGLHIGFIFALLNMLTRKRKTFGMAVVMIIVLFLYGEMTMWSASTVRAVLVMSIKLLSTFLKRSFDMLSSISFVAILLLLINPYQLFNTGFQMSFIAMLGITFVAPFLKFWVGESLAMLLAVQIAIAPFTVYVFHRFNVLSIFINIPIVFIASILVPICIVALMIECVLAGCPDILIDVISGITDILISINHWLTFDNAFSVDLCSPKLSVLLGFYAVCLIGCSEWTRIRLIRKRYFDVASVASVAFVAVIVVSGAFNSLDKADVIFVSVGQGDCTHIMNRQIDVLIDGGGARDYNIGEKTLKPYLLSNRADSVDYAVATHLHMDHFKGLIELSEEGMVDNILIPSIAKKDFEGKYSAKTFKKSKETKEFKESAVKCLDFGDKLKLSKDVCIEAIWPKSNSANVVGADDENEINMVYMVNYKGVKIMVTGDIPSSEEEKMVEYYRGTDKLKCDILKVAHHGSKGSSCDAFLDAARPSIAVISVGKNNMYGHPNEEALDRLETRGIKVYRTDVNGAVGVDVTNRGGFVVNTMMEF